MSKPMTPNDVMYTKSGQMVEVWRVLEDTVLVHPMVKVIYQDDYRQEEEYEPSDRLMRVAPHDLSETPPVDVIDQEILDKRQELADLKRSFEAERAEALRAKAEMASAERQLEQWKSKHQHFIDLGRLLDGDPMFPLHSPDNHYHGGPSIPSIPKWRDVKFMCITPNVFRNEERWQIYQHSDYSGCTLRFFYSEEEREAFVTTRFAEACDKFRKNPDFGTTSHTTTPTLHYGTLEKWCTEFPHLSIPDDVVSGKAEADAEKKKAETLALREKLRELDATP